MKLIREFGQTSPRFSIVPPGSTSDAWGQNKKPPELLRRALKKVPVFGKTNKKAASYCTSEQFSDGQILSLFCLTQWLRYLYNDLQRVI